MILITVHYNLIRYIYINKPTLKSFCFVCRFTIYKVHKASKKKREKSSAKKERKATKTLAIVLGNEMYN